MDTLDRLMRRIDRIDERMIVLFEKRMRLVRAMAAYKGRHDIKSKMRRHYGDILVKTTCNVSDSETIVYTEGLVAYLGAAAQKYTRTLIKHQ